MSDQEILRQILQRLTKVEVLLETTLKNEQSFEQKIHLLEIEVAQNIEQRKTIKKYVWFALTSGATIVLAGLGYLK